MTHDEEIATLKAALVKADLDYQELGEKYGDLLEQKRCDCSQMIEPPE